MPTWILIVVVSQFLIAVSAIVDKFIVTSKKVSGPFVYAFFVSSFSVLAVLIFFLGFLPFDWGIFNIPKIQNISWPDFNLMFFSIFSGIAFFVSLFTIYSAFKDADASDVVPVVSSVSAIFTFLISFLFLNEVLAINFFYGFIFLVIGMVILSHFRFTFRSGFYAFLSGLFFAIYYSIMKVMFNIYSFDQTFFWTRIGILIVILILLLVPRFNKMIFSGLIKTKTKNGLWIIANNTIGGLSGIILLKATEIGSVTIVQALGSLQFAFLIIISIIFGRITPVTFGENNNFIDIIQKIISVSFIVLGFILLFI